MHAVWLSSLWNNEKKKVVVDWDNNEENSGDNFLIIFIDIFLFSTSTLEARWLFFVPYRGVRTNQVREKRTKRFFFPPDSMKN